MEGVSIAAWQARQALASLPVDDTNVTFTVVNTTINNGPTPVNVLVSSAAGVALTGVTVEVTDTSGFAVLSANPISMPNLSGGGSFSNNGISAAVPFSIPPATVTFTLRGTRVSDGQLIEKVSTAIWTAA